MLINISEITAIFFGKIAITIVEDIITHVAPVNFPFNSWSFSILLKNKAKNLLIKGFFLEVIEKITDKEIKNIIKFTMGLTK